MSDVGRSRGLLVINVHGATRPLARRMPAYVPFLRCHQCVKIEFVKACNIGWTSIGLAKRANLGAPCDGRHPVGLRGTDCAKSLVGRVNLSLYCSQFTCKPIGERWSVARVPPGRHFTEHHTALRSRIFYSAQLTSIDWQRPLLRFRIFPTCLNRRLEISTMSSERRLAVRRSSTTPSRRRGFCSSSTSMALSRTDPT